jgi:hypothetical protein
MLVSCSGPGRTPPSELFAPRGRATERTSSIQDHPRIRYRPRAPSRGEAQSWSDTPSRHRSAIPGSPTGCHQRRSCPPPRRIRICTGITAPIQPVFSAHPPGPPNAQPRTVYAQVDVGSRTYPCLRTSTVWAIHLSRLRWCGSLRAPSRRRSGRPLPETEATRLAWTAPAPDDSGAIRPDEVKSAQMDSPKHRNDTPLSS